MKSSFNSNALTAVTFTISTSTAQSKSKNPALLKRLAIEEESHGKLLTDFAADVENLPLSSKKITEKTRRP